MKIIQLQTVFFAGLFFSLILTPLFILIAKKLKIVDHPIHRKTHKEPIPYLGGVALFASILLAFILVTSLRSDLAQYLGDAGFMKAILILGCSLGVAAIGLMDDIQDLPARYKIMGQGIFVSLFVIFGFRFEILHIPGLHPLQLSFLAIPLTIFWILSIINAFNMVDGLDGLTATVAAGSLCLLAGGCSIADNQTGLFLSLAGLGAIFGFLPYNWKPARIYLGDAGSGGLGAFLACSLVALGQTHGQPNLNLKTGVLVQPFNYQILIATLLVAYPALEIILSVSRRLIHGRPISRGDQGHIHHRLLKIGWHTPFICVTALVITMLPGLAAIATIAKYHGWATWILATCGVLLGLGLSTLGFLDFLKPKIVQSFRPHFQIAHHFISMQRVKLSLASNREEILTLVNQTCQELGVGSYHLIVSSDQKGMGGLDYVHQWDPIKNTSEKHKHDHVTLSANRGGAEWVFDPQSEEQEELDMEYRVLISEFMREALETAYRLGKHEETLDLPSVANLPARSVSSHALRKRKKPRPKLDPPNIPSRFN